MILINETEITKSYFSNTEVRLKEFDCGGYIVVELKYETENESYKVNDDLMCLYFVKQELDRLNKKANLVLYSMPYQRMDHKSGTDIHTLPYVAKFINDLNFTEVIVIEPHSDKTVEYLADNATMIYPVPRMLRWITNDNELCHIENKDDIYVIFPDAGAFRRYRDELEGYNICVFTKKRDHETNQIVKHELSIGQITRGSICFILDDICSSGQTLLDVAYYAKMAGASKVYVVVAHCENRALEGELLKPYSPVDMMYTTTSMISCDHPKITYIDII